MNYRTFVLLPEFGTNTYLVWNDKKEAVVFDVAAPGPELLEFIRENDLELRYILLTHGHGDHIGGIRMVKNEYPVPLGIHQDDAGLLTDPHKNLSTLWNQELKAPEADLLLKDGDLIKLGDIDIKVIHTPGHTRGGVCFLVEDLLISGDTLFCESIGRADLPGGDYHTLLNSIRTKLLILPDSTRVLPGHGPESTIEDEKAGNPFVGILAGKTDQFI